MDETRATDREWKEVLGERKRQFRHLLWVLASVIVFLFVFVPYWSSQPDSYDAHREQAQAKPAATWPDGSPKTDHDWWADPKTAAQHLAAEAKAAPSPHG